jgi:uncharacterized membrane protein YeaQ/YmgE (transglycosylase-associated protein family)
MATVLARCLHMEWSVRWLLASMQEVTQMVLVQFAQINFGLGIIGWIIVGLIAGWLAHMVAGSGSGSIVSDLIVGLVGAFIGGIVLGLFFNGTTGVILSIVVAFIGALLLTWIVRALMGSRSPV